MNKISPKRLEAAKQRLLGRYPDRDKQEVDIMVNSFKGKTQEQIKADFKKATEVRELKVENEKLREIINCLYGDNLYLSGWHLNDELKSVDELFEENGWV